MSTAKKITKGNHLPSEGDGRFPVHSKQFNELVENVQELQDAPAGISQGDPITTDTIDESTLNAGVTVESVLLKDGKICPSNGAVSQASSIVTPVTLNTTVGTITTQALTAAPGTSHIFTLNNSTITASSIVLVSGNNYGGTYGTNGIPVVEIDTIASGSCQIVISNADSVGNLVSNMDIVFHVLC